MQICGHFGAAPPVSLLWTIASLASMEKCYFTLCFSPATSPENTVIHYSALAIVLPRFNVLMLSDAALDLVVAGCCCILIFSRKMEMILLLLMLLLLPIPSDAYDDEEVEVEESRKKMMFEY